MSDANLVEVEGRGIVRAVTLAGSPSGLRLMVVLVDGETTRRLVFSRPLPLDRLDRLVTAEHLWVFTTEENDRRPVVLAFWCGAIHEIEADAMEDLDRPGYSTRPEAPRDARAADTRPGAAADTAPGAETV